jgi:hypothetical protein
MTALDVDSALVDTHLAKATVPIDKIHVQGSLDSGWERLIIMERDGACGMQRRFLNAPWQDRRT